MSRAQQVNNLRRKRASRKRAPFLAENTAAMDKMMADTDVKPTGDVDADFVAMMIPHHQGASESAAPRRAALPARTSKFERIAQEIIVEQQQEIAAMRLAMESATAALRAGAHTTHQYRWLAPGTNWKRTRLIHDKRDVTRRFRARLRCR